MKTVTILALACAAIFTQPLLSEESNRATETISAIEQTTTTTKKMKRKAAKRNRDKAKAQATATTETRKEAESDLEQKEAAPSDGEATTPSTP